MLRARGSRCAGWGRGVGGRPASSSETCCSSSVRSKDGVIERPCSQEVPELTVSISGNRRRENLSPALGGVHRECGGFPLLRSQPCYHISTWARAPGEASWGGRCCLEGVECPWPLARRAFQRRQLLLSLGLVAFCLRRALRFAWLCPPGAVWPKSGSRGPSGLVQASGRPAACGLLDVSPGAFKSLYIAVLSGASLQKKPFGFILFKVIFKASGNKTSTERRWQKPSLCSF